ncbi:MAG: tRNA (N6-isopentenyl adenosine(37)-C2)-methylthiotransferase MiaB [Nitrospirota bacterium]
MLKTVYIRTFGCQMNVHDSEKMLGILQEEGYSQSPDPRGADLIIFNTCSIRQKAEQKFYSELGKAKAYKKRKPGIKIAVAGCIAQQEGKNILRKAPYVDFIFGPQNIHKLPDILSRAASPVATDDNPGIATTDLPVKRGEGVKAWVTIMYGCNNFCSYCVVPYTRGWERSRPSDNIYSEVAELSERGYKEITLLGQNVNSYRSETDFPGLLRKLDRIRGIERIRFVTSHPRDLSAELISAMADLSKVCEHIHLPLQSGSSKILELMNRGYTYEDYLRKVSNLRREIPGVSITSDIIAGFPGETEDDHMLTVKALKEIEFDGIFVFKFSPRPGTKAAAMSAHLSETVKSERLTEILKIQDEITTQRNRSLEGTIQEVLIEGVSESDEKKITGRTRTNKIVNIPEIDVERGTLLHVEITKGRPHSLEGKPLDRIQGVKDSKGEKIRE